MSNLPVGFCSSPEVQYTCIGAIDQVGVGQLSYVPLHMKLLPYFTIDGSVTDLLDSVENAAHIVESFEIRGGGEAYYSEQHDHRVREVCITGEVIKAHEVFLQYVSRSARFLQPSYVGGGYKPHISANVFPESKRWIRRGERVRFERAQLMAKTTTGLYIIYESVLGGRNQEPNAA